METEFEEHWAEGKVPGWENGDTDKGNTSLESIVDLDYYSTVEELMELGPEKLKEVGGFPFPVILFKISLVVI